MPQDINRDSARALLDHQPFNRGNTKVQQSIGLSRLYLHDNRIAILDPDNVVRISCLNHPTRTTAARLNAILTLANSPLRVRIIKGRAYLVDPSDRGLVHCDVTNQFWPVRVRRKRCCPICKTTFTPTTNLTTHRL